MCDFLNMLIDHLDMKQVVKFCLFCFIFSY